MTLGKTALVSTLVLFRCTLCISQTKVSDFTKLANAQDPQFFEVSVDSITHKRTVHNKLSGETEVFDSSGTKILQYTTFWQADADGKYWMKLSGSYKEWHGNGKLKQSGSYVNGNKSMKWTSYFETGKLKSEEFWQVFTWFDTTYGSYLFFKKEYHENGATSSYGIYRPCSECDTSVSPTAPNPHYGKRGCVLTSRPAGEWRYFDPSGVLLRKEFYP